MPELAHPFSPFTIRNITIRNRIFQSAHGTAFGEKGQPTERHVRCYEARAKGGVGLIIQEGSGTKRSRARRTLKRAGKVCSGSPLPQNGKRSSSQAADARGCRLLWPQS